MLMRMWHFSRDITLVCRVLFRCLGLYAMSLDLFQMETELSTYPPTTVPRVFSLTRAKLYHLLIILQRQIVSKSSPASVSGFAAPNGLRPVSFTRTPHGRTEKFQLNFRSYLQRELFKNNSHRLHTTNWFTVVPMSLRLWPSPAEGFRYLSPPPPPPQPPPRFGRSSVRGQYITITIVVIIILGVLRKMSNVPQKSC